MLLIEGPELPKPPKHHPKPGQYSTSQRASTRRRGNNGLLLGHYETPEVSKATFSPRKLIDGQSKVISDENYNNSTADNDSLKSEENKNVDNSSMQIWIAIIFGSVILIVVLFFLGYQIPRVHI